MYIAGEWFRCADDVIRPVIRAEMRGPNDNWVEVVFLVDTAADRTTLSAQILRRLGQRPLMPVQQLAGLGGIVQAVLIQSTIYFTREGGGKVPVRGQYAAVTEYDSLDMSVLGRDVLQYFALIVDGPGKAVCLINQNHQYTITAS